MTWLPATRTGLLGLVAVALGVAIHIQGPSRTIRATEPGDTVPQTTVAVPAAAAPPRAVAVYEAASVLAAVEPKIELAPTPAPRIEIPVVQKPQTAAPPPKRRPEPMREIRPTLPVADNSPRPWEAATSEPVLETPKPEPTPFRVAPPQQAVVGVSGGLRPGQFPPLAVDFQTIGLERYARATEAAGGAFFAYMGTRGIGPQISLAGQRTLQSARELNLAVERPYLVSDPSVAERLHGLDLPDGASPTSVVMLWPRWLDARAWDAIEQALREERLDGDQIAQVNASFGETPDRPVLQIVGFTLRGDGKMRRLAHPRTIPVAS